MKRLTTVACQDIEGLSNQTWSDGGQKKRNGKKIRNEKIKPEDRRTKTRRFMKHLLLVMLWKQDVATKKFLCHNYIYMILHFS